MDLHGTLRSAIADDAEGESRGQCVHFLCSARRRDASPSLPKHPRFFLSFEKMPHTVMADPFIRELRWGRWKVRVSHLSHGAALVIVECNSLLTIFLKNTLGLVSEFFHGLFCKAEEFFSNRLPIEMVVANTNWTCSYETPRADLLTSLREH